MLKPNKTGVRIFERLFLIMLVTAFSYELGITHTQAADKPVTPQPDPEHQTEIGKDGFHPHPNIGPQDVIRIQLEALANNNNPNKDAGIEIAFRFTSPANKQVTGPLSRFIQMLYNPQYAPMLKHQGVTYGDLVKENDRAVQSVILKADDGKRVGYIFILSKQKGGLFNQCWMTDSVIRFEVNAV